MNFGHGGPAIANFGALVGLPRRRKETVELVTKAELGKAAKQVQGMTAYLRTSVNNQKKDLRRRTSNGCKERWPKICLPLWPRKFELASKSGRTWFPRLPRRHCILAVSQTRDCPCHRATRPMRAVVFSRDGTPTMRNVARQAGRLRLRGAARGVEVYDDGEGPGSHTTSSPKASTSNSAEERSTFSRRARRASPPRR